MTISSVSDSYTVLIDIYKDDIDNYKDGIDTYKDLMSISNYRSGHGCRMI